MMGRKRHTPEQTINKLRQAEVEIANGATIAQVCKKIGVTDQTYYRWRSEYGGMRVDQAKRLKDLEAENEDAPGLKEMNTALDEAEALVGEGKFDTALEKAKEVGRKADAELKKLSRKKRR